MIDVIRQQFSPGMDDEAKLNRAREVLQILALKIISDKGFFDDLSFTGGTALRVLFGLRRFSEDLDFSLVQKKGHDFPGFLSAIVAGLRLYGLDAEAAKVKAEKSVHSAFLKFSGLLKAVGISPLGSEKLSIKIEVDSNPPKGGRTQVTLVNKMYIFTVTHFDIPSLFATKLHACFYRKFTKGRDFYDLIWYISQKITPNFLLLNNAIEQTQGVNPALNESSFKDFLLAGIEKIDFNLAKKDVERFLEEKSELRLFDKKVIKSTIESAYAK